MIYENLTPETLVNQKLIYSLDSGKYFTYFHHKFDDFCVALVDKEGNVDVPLDKEYFGTLKELGQVFGNERTYSLFLRVYLLVERGMKTPNEIHWSKIRKWTNEYIGDKTEYFDVVFETMCTLYIAMISEENHLYYGKIPPMGKDVKKIGVYQCLYEDFSPTKTANFTKKMKWRDMDKISKEHNIKTGLPENRWRLNGFAS